MGKPIALRRFAQAIFTRFHVPQLLGDIALWSSYTLPPKSILIDLTPERPIRDIARSHEAIIDVAPDAAGPVAATPTRDCIFKVGIAVVLAHHFPRQRWCETT